MEERERVKLFKEEEGKANFKIVIKFWLCFGNKNLELGNENLNMQRAVVIYSSA